LSLRPESFIHSRRRQDEQHLSESSLLFHLLVTKTLPRILEECTSSRDSHRIRAGRPGFDSKRGQEIFIFFTASRPAMVPTEPRGVKRPWREADHSPQSNAEVKNAWSYAFTPPHLDGVTLNVLSSKSVLALLSGPRHKEYSLLAFDEV
jgi:hypothetical protein